MFEENSKKGELNLPEKYYLIPFLVIFITNSRKFNKTNNKRETTIRRTSKNKQLQSTT